MKETGMFEETHKIAEDDAHAIFTMLEKARWVHLCQAAKPHLQMSRKIKASTGRMRKGRIWWFSDKLLTRRVHADVRAFMEQADMKRAGDNRAPKYQVTHDNMDQCIRVCARKANIQIISEQDIFRAKGLRDSRVLNRIGRN